MWLLRIISRFNADARMVMESYGMNLDVSGAKAQQTFGFTFIPVEQALIASAGAIQALTQEQQQDAA